MDNRIWEVVRRIEESQALVVLTGAGVSTDSGISDFRSPDGLYSRWDRNLVFNIDYFHQDPTYFYRFAKEELYRFDSIEPNVTHRLLALLESEGYLKMLITQNIDGLHQKAGTRAIIELHGGVSQGHCQKCGKAVPAERIKEAIARAPVARCDDCGGLVKPDVIFFGEALDTSNMENAFYWSRKADVFLVLGSSLQVYPAGYLPEVAKRSGAYLAIVDQQDTAQDDIADRKLVMPLRDFSEALYGVFSSPDYPKTDRGDRFK